MDSLLPVAEFVRDQFNRGTVIGNAYDNGQFRNLNGDRASDLIFVGRLVSEKGCDTLLQAVAKIGEAGLRPTLTVIGDGPLRSSLKALAQRLGIGEQITFLGACGPSVIAAELNRHRIMVVPSIYREPFGIVALEGLACGCRLIVSQDGGLVEAAGGHVLTFRNGDVLDLADTLTTALQEPASLARQQPEVAAHLARHTRRAIAERYLAAFQGAAA